MTLARDHIPADRRRSARLLALLALGLAARCALADEDPCARFSWNIAHERALFATAPVSLAAGRDASSTPPGKKTSIEGAHAGLARLRLQQPGVYRVSVDRAAWIDVVADGSMIESADFQGRPGCLAPHKIVQYSLPAGRKLVLQLSAAAGLRLRLAITHVD
jgi:hypothetical protein